MTRKFSVWLILFTIGCSQQNDPSERSHVENSGAVASKPFTLQKTSTPEVGIKSVAIPHKNEGYGFSIHLPEGWGPVSKDALAAQGAAVSGPNLKIDYIAGYQVLSNDLFVHPFILVRRLPENVMPKKKINSARQLFQRSGSEIARRAEQAAGQRVNMNVGVPVLEEETGIVWLKIQMDGVDGQRVEGLMAHYYVDGHILQFGAGTTEVRGKEDWPVLERILRTITIHAR
jgi:hypothetical protein